MLLLSVTQFHPLTQILLSCDAVRSQASKKTDLHDKMLYREGSGSIPGCPVTTSTSLLRQLANVVICLFSIHREGRKDLRRGCHHSQPQAPPLYGYWACTSSKESRWEGFRDAEESSISENEGRHRQQETSPSSFASYLGYAG